MAHTARECHNKIHCGENEQFMQILHQIPLSVRQSDGTISFRVISSDLFLIFLIAATFLPCTALARADPNHSKLLIIRSTFGISLNAWNCGENE